MKLPPPAPGAAEAHGGGRQHRRRVLLVNVDFRDAVYSYLWGRAVLDACRRLDFDVDVVTVNPFVGRDIAVELGVERPALDPHVDGTVVYVDQPDDARIRSAIGQLLERYRYETLVLNCDAALFTHLVIDRGRDLAGAFWSVYDRHLHLGLAALERDARLRDYLRTTNIHVFGLEEIVTPGDPTFGAAYAPVPNEASLLTSFGRLGFEPARVHFQRWPLDDDFFAPRPNAAPNDRFVIFSGGDSGRDYATLFEAIRGLPIELRLCAGSYPAPAPPNVTILPRLPLHRFRDEVAQASVVVVPVTGHPPVSGITVIAMAKMLGKPVIAADNRVVRIHIRSQGDGGYLSQAGNAALLRGLLALLMESRAERERLARDARAQAVRDLGLKAFVHRMLELQ